MNQKECRLYLGDLLTICQGGTNLNKYALPITKASSKFIALTIIAYRNSYAPIDGNDVFTIENI